MATEDATRGIDPKEHLSPDPKRIDERLQKTLDKALYTGGSETAQKARDFLNGTWLGELLHVILIDAPIGAWTLALLFDGLELITKRREFALSADTSIAMGLVGASEADRTRCPSAERTWAREVRTDSSSSTTRMEVFRSGILAPFYVLERVYREYANASFCNTGHYGTFRRGLAELVRLLGASATPGLNALSSGVRSCKITFRRDLCTRIRPLYSRKPSLRNRFMKKLTRDRVVPIISANVSCEILGINVSGSPGSPNSAINRRILARRFSLELKS